MKPLRKSSQWQDGLKIAFLNVANLIIMTVFLSIGKFVLEESIYPRPLEDLLYLILNYSFFFGSVFCFVKSCYHYAREENEKAILYGEFPVACAAVFLMFVID